MAITSTLLMAPQTQEFGTKVALLGGLVIVCAARPLLDWLDKRLAAGARRPGTAVRAGVIGAALLIVGVGIVAAGGPARNVVAANSTDILGRVPHDIDPATLPRLNVEQDVVDWNHEIVGAKAQELVLTLVENLELENQALLRNDATVLTAVDHGDRLEEMQGRLRQAEASGATVIDRYQIDDVNIRLLVPFGRQDGLSLGLDSRGTVTQETYDASGQLQSRVSSPFAKTFALRRATGGRWLNVAVLPLGADR